MSVLYGGSRLMISNQLSAGDLMSFLVTAQTIQRSMAQLSVLFGQAVRGYTAGSRVFQVDFLNARRNVDTVIGGRNETGRNLCTFLERFFSYHFICML